MCDWYNLFYLFLYKKIKSQFFRCDMCHLSDYDKCLITFLFSIKVISFVIFFLFFVKKSIYMSGVHRLILMKTKEYIYPHKYLNHLWLWIYRSLNFYIHTFYFLSTKEILTYHDSLLENRQVAVVNLRVFWLADLCVFFFEIRYR